MNISSQQSFLVCMIYGFQATYFEQTGIPQEKFTPKHVRQTPAMDQLGKFEMEKSIPVGSVLGKERLLMPLRVAQSGRSIDV